MDPKVLLKNKWLLVLGILGLLCLVGGSLWNGRAANTSGSVPTSSVTSAAAGVGGETAQVGSSQTGTDSSTVDAITQSYESQMQQMLEKLVGVNSVSVMVSIDSTSQITLANSQKTTTDSSVNGKESRHSTTTDTQPFTETVGGDSLPIVTQTQMPAVQGVLVLVNANDFYVAKSEIIDAITNVWDVPAYNISVEPEK